MVRRSQTQGFTLIELLIVLAIIAVLSAIALPQFQDASRKSHRAEAQQIILDISSRQAMYLLDAHAYTSSFTSLGVAIPKGWSCTPTSTCTTVANSYYSIAATVVTTPPTFTIQATATGTQVKDGDLQLSDAGVKTRIVSGTATDLGW